VQSKTDLAEAPRRSNAFASMGLTAVAIMVAAVAAVMLVFRFADVERERELIAWQSRLGIIADTRASAVNSWLDRQLEEVTRLAENASVQLYTSDLARDSKSDATPTALAQSGYLANLLAVTASRSGFAKPAADREPGANVRRSATAGIAILASDGRVLVASAGMPPLDGRLAEFIRDARPGERALLDAYIGVAGAAAMAFAAPIYAVQGDGDPASQIGWVLGVRELAPGLFNELHQPGLAWKTAEIELVRRRAGVAEYLSPARETGAAALRRLALDTPELDAAFALANPGGFGVKRDSRGEPVLVTSRRIERAPWLLVLKIDRSEALSASDGQLAAIVNSLLLVIALVVAGMIALWRHGASRRAGASAERLATFARRYENQGRLLRLVADSVAASLFIVDAEGRFHFANKAAAARARAAPDELTGKSIADVYGAAEAARYARPDGEALRTGRTVIEIAGVGTGRDARVVRSEHVPLPATLEFQSGVLVTEQDITDVVRARERRAQMLSGLVETVVAIIDQRDPHAANHSTHVSKIAVAIAKEMGLPEVEIETAAIAGAVMNVGKILVPIEILTRSGELTGDEKRQVRESIEASADLFERVSFEGPVAQTLRQINEHWDGSGTPLGLKGEDILRPARVVAVANAFVALSSPRAWRAGIDPDEALARLLSEAGKTCDRAVIAALISLHDNRGGKDEWRGFSAQPPKGAAA
jgi:HD-GYP domain-containing protein (c-di-GMP phosphodiesterase class II)